MADRLFVPHERKQQAILRCKAALGAEVFVETGTFQGDMVLAMAPHFKEVHSVELSLPLHEVSRRRTMHLPNVNLGAGPSDAWLRALVPTLGAPTVFWLDAHYSGPGTEFHGQWCPVREELDGILSSIRTRFIVLIDDAQDFRQDNNYPTLGEIEALVGRYPIAGGMVVEDDIVRIMEARAPA